MSQQPYAPQPQYPGYPQQPVQQGYPPQQFAPQAPVQQPYPPQQYAPPVQAPAQPVATGSLDDFYNQPSTGGGASLKFEQVGTRYIGIVTRPLGPGDVQQQTNTQGVPLFFKDGRPKWVMKIPLQMQPSPAYPDGTAQWYVKGATRDELARAMAEAGVDAREVQAGAIIDITFTGTRPSGAGMNPAKLFRVVYTPPEGAAQTQPPQGTGAPSPAPVPQQAPVQQYEQPQVPQQQFQPPAQVPQVAQQAVPQPPAPPVQQQAAPQPPSDLSADQQALLARLTGGQQPAA
jgi:hypothetical protein